ncbi:MAG TPA: hypothetical protein VIG33_03260 [Pseudobdellovibrionaceae bacterium]|jgi:hypothetical protein
MNARAFFKKLGSENLSELERKTDLSRRALGSAKKTHNMKLENLEVLADAMGFSVQFLPQESEDNVLLSLKRFGAPLAHESGGNLDLTEALVCGMNLARQDGLYESIVPYVMAQNSQKLHPLDILSKVHLRGDHMKVVGYFAEMANHFKPHPHLAELMRLAQVFNPDLKQKELLLKKEKVNFPELFEKNKTALRWGLLTRGSERDHLERWAKWQQSRKSP